MSPHTGRSKGKFCNWKLLCTYFLISITPILFAPYSLTSLAPLFFHKMFFHLTWFSLEGSVGTPGLMYHSVVLCYWHKIVICMQISMCSFLDSFSKHLLNGEHCSHLLGIRHPKTQITVLPVKAPSEGKRDLCPKALQLWQVERSRTPPEAGSRVFWRRWHLG